MDKSSNKRNRKDINIRRSDVLKGRQAETSHGRWIMTQRGRTRTRTERKVRKNQEEGREREEKETSGWEHIPSVRDRQSDSGRETEKSKRSRIRGKE